MKSQGADPQVRPFDSLQGSFSLSLIEEVKEPGSTYAIFEAVGRSKDRNDF